jgi:acyl dehydratase
VSFVAGDSVITEEMRKVIGVESEPVIYEVEKGAIRKFADAIGDPNPLYYDEEYAKKSRYGGIIAPPGFFGWPVKGGFVTTHPFDTPLKSLLNGGSEFEYFQPVRAGDVLSVTNKVTDLYEREGRLGRMLFTQWESTYRNQKGEIVAKARGTFINY